MNALDNKCPGCAAILKFNPKEQCWKCEYCGQNYTLEQLQKHNNASNLKYQENKTIKTEEVDSYHCKNCGATIVADTHTTATFCVYCGNTAILKEKIQNNRMPDLIIPFNSTKEDAVSAFKKISKGRPLMPKFFNKQENIEKIKGIYIPFWIYSLNVSGNAQLKGEKVKRWSIGDTTYVKTDIYNMLREGSMNFNRVPVDGSTRFTDDIMNTIEPFDYKGLKEYNHAYLSGFFAEKYDVETSDAYKIALSRINQSIRETLLESCKEFSRVSLENNNITPKSVKEEYILLPVWMVNVKYNNKMYLFAMNGQTKEFVGNIPIDINKTIIYSILIFIASLILTILISYIFFIIGG